MSEIIVRTAADRRLAESWSLVLEALAIPHRLSSMGPDWAVAVDDAHLERATAALAAHDREAAETTAEPLAPDHGRGATWVAVAVPAALVAFFLVTGTRGGALGHGWFRSGSAIAARIVAGEWQRAVTALTLHADLMHVAGNAVALVIFMSALCRWLGAGLALLLVLAAGAAGNLATAYAYGGGHDSVGASTAAFGALGLLGGLQFVRRYRVTSRIDRRRRALTAVAACLGMFAMVGVGERSDVLAHLSGLLAGLCLGVATGLGVRQSIGTLVQAALGALSVGVVAAAWWSALATR